jgi:hypothetical protein
VVAAGHPQATLTGRISWFASDVLLIWGPCHDHRQLETRATSEVLTANDVRTVIAGHLSVDVSRVTDEAYFSDDLGADCSTAWN